MPEPLPKLEEKVLDFWKKNRIFEKTLAQRRRAKPFRFFEGPPTANAAPGFHHVLARVYKDFMCRWKTMAGFYVERKAGWDTHGLPVELQVEKELGMKHKGEIEKFGIAEFNKKAKDMTWRFKGEWERFTERLGYWLDLENPYISYDPKYMETLWWIIKKVWQKGLLEEDFKVVPWCPRCETPLSSHEVAQGYEDITEESVYVKFPLKGSQFKNHFFLAWTTAPWTLPGHAALVVNQAVDYVWVKLNEASEVFILAKERLSVISGEYTVLKETKGRELIGLRYVPVFDFLAKLKIPNLKNAFRVLPADFASAEEGTGVVHTAVMYGEEDFTLGKKYKLPAHHTVDEHGRFTRDVPKWRGRFVKDVEKEITADLENRDLLFKREVITHTYPFCWRCQTPLLYYAHKSWFIRMSKLKSQVISNNRKINWIPEHLKEGRFGEWLRELKDWAFSRERYWGTPLPIWICGKCQKIHVVGSVEELSRLSLGANVFYRMRHGGAQHVGSYIAGWPEKRDMISHLTEKGRAQVARSARRLARHRIDLIVSSDLTRMKETVAVLKKYLKHAKVIYDSRLREYNTGIYNYRPPKEFHRIFKSREEKFTKKPPGGETLIDACNRYFAVVSDLEKNYQGKNILVLGHGDPLWALEGKLRGLSARDIIKSPYPKLGGWEKLPYTCLPRNEEGELDLHRPYVDEILLRCPRCRSKMQRVKDVADVWYDSGAMPFAQWHWPFENREKIDKGIHFPADYIAEAIDQTRGWFYTLLAVSTLLGKGPAYLNVISTGHVLDEKGEKMSKSKGNVVDPWEMFNKYGADSLRWYFFTVNPPGEPKKFAEKDLAKTHQDLLILYNVLKFWETYSPRKIEIRKSKIAKHVLDRWISAKLSRLIVNVREKVDRYEIVEAAREMQNFFIEDLSRWYVRRSRGRFQRPENQKELRWVAAVLGKVMLELSRLMAAFTPFLAETIWQSVTSRMGGRALPKSVHLASLPTSPKVAGAATVLKGGEAARQLAALGLKARAQAGIKVRQPLGILEVLMQRDAVRLPKEWLDVVSGEINVKDINFVPRLSVGDSWSQAEEANWRVALNTYLTPQLRDEGIVREIIRNIQGGRAELGLNPGDPIMVWIDGPAEIDRLVEQSRAFISRMTGAKLLSRGKTEKFHFHRQYEIDGQPVEIAVRKLK